MSVVGHFERKLAETRDDINALRNEIDALKNERRELTLIVERLRIDGRGEKGETGPRGVPGRDGSQGPVGPQGRAGPRGEAAPRIATWAIDADGFTATPVLADGSSGAPLNLLTLFQAYDSAAILADDLEVASAAVEARAATEREAEAARWSR